MNRTNLSNQYALDWEEMVGKYVIANAVVLGLYLVIGIVGNILVLVVYKYQMKNVSDERYFIPILATSDIFATLVGSINCMILDLMQSTFTNVILCKILFFTICISAAISIFILLCIALQRYLLICRKRPLSLLQRRIMLGVSITLSVISATPFLFTYGINDFYSNGVYIGTRCGRLKEGVYIEGVAYAIFFGSFLVFTISSLVFFYGRIGCVIFGHFKGRKSSNATPSKDTTESELDSNLPSAEISDASQIKQNHFSSNQDVSRPLHSTDSVASDTTKQKLYKTNTLEVPKPQWQPKNRNSDIHVSERPLSGTDFQKKKIQRQNTRTKKRNRRFKMKFSIMFMVVTTVSLVCYCPVGIIVTLEGLFPDFWDGLTKTEFIVLLWLYHTYIVNSIANPIIYAFLDTEFYVALKAVLRKFWRK